MSGNKEGGDVAAEGTGAETRTSAPKTRPTGDQEWKEQRLSVCSPPLLKEYGGMSSGDSDIAILESSTGL